jgi:hypothetical protein
VAIGDYETAGTDLGASIGIWRRLGDRGGEATSLAMLAKLHLIRSDVTGAWLLYQRTLDLARQVTSPWDEAHALAGLGRCARADGDARKASGLLTQAYRIFQRIGSADAAEVAAECAAAECDAAECDAAECDAAGTGGIVGTPR